MRFVVSLKPEEFDYHGVDSIILHNIEQLEPNRLQKIPSIEVKR